MLGWTQSTSMEKEAAILHRVLLIWIKNEQDRKKQLCFTNDLLAFLGALLLSQHLRQAEVWMQSSLGEETIFHGLLGLEANWLASNFGL